MKKTVLIALVTGLLIYGSNTTLAGLVGDTNGDGKIDIVEAIYALQVAANVTPQLPASCNITSKDAWQTAISYVMCDVVKYNGSYYICTQDHISAPTNAPPDISVWTVLGIKGDPGEVQVPLSLSGSTGQYESILGVENTGAGAGIYGSNTSFGAYGLVGAGDAGVVGEHAANGFSGKLGLVDSAVAGESFNTDSTGKLGTADYGVYGHGGIGVYGDNNENGNHGYLGGGTYGAYGSVIAGQGYAGVYGTSGDNYGHLGSDEYGVYGHNSNGNYGFIGGPMYSVAGFSSGGDGVYGINTTSNNFGTLGSSHAAVSGTAGEGVGAFAGYFEGNVHVSGDLGILGNLSKGGGSFKIDHPLDPENKYLYHSFVESPDMKNIYDGIVSLDKYGEAWVELPEWFEALNKDFRYQLTCVGDFAPVFIAEKIENNRFKIAGGHPGMEISWQVTGTRQDPYAEAHRIPVEQDKPEDMRGTYLYPEVYSR